jgi:hypothetical protein
MRHRARRRYAVATPVPGVRPRCPVSRSRLLAHFRSAITAQPRRANLASAKAGALIDHSRATVDDVSEAAPRPHHL